jgi:hypothetical protein
LHNDGSGVAHQWFLANEYSVGWNVASHRGSLHVFWGLLYVFCQALFTSGWKVYTGGVGRGARAWRIDKRLPACVDLWSIHASNFGLPKSVHGRVQFSLNNVVIFAPAACIS